MAHRDSGRYPRQLVVMVTEATDEAIRLTCDATGRSLSDVLREVVDIGLPPVVRRARKLQALKAEIAEEYEATV